MTPFLKYILVSLLFFVLLTAVSYRFLKPQSSFSSHAEKQITADAQQLDTLSRAFKLAVQGEDKSALAQTKGNFQAKLKEMYLRSSALKALDTTIIRNYSSLIALNQTMVTNKKQLADLKQKYRDEIDKLTSDNQFIQVQIANISIQPLPAPVK